MTEKKKVLVGEDSSVIQNLTRKILGFRHYEIISAKNGKQVLEMLQKERFDVLLLDINMPVMDGMECTKRIREMEDETKKNIPIIAITGNARNYTMEEFEKVGVNEVALKPIDFDALVEMVKKHTE